MKQNSKKLLYSLYAAGAVLGASMLSGCCQTRYVYLNADGTPYTPRTTYTPTSTPTYQSSARSDVPGQILSGVLMGLGGL